MKQFENENDENKYAIALSIMGWIIMVGGVIGAGVLGSEYRANYWSYNWTVFWVAALSSVMSGLLVLGIAEIIKILHDSRKYLRKLAQEPSITSNRNSNTGVESSELPDI